jgi:type IV pilus assembly protein PilA
MIKQAIVQHHELVDNQHVDVHVPQGFSLLELLLVVALIGVLAAYVVPTYQGYMERTRFMEVVQQTQAVRVSQMACFMRTGNDLSQCDSFAKIGLAVPVTSNNTASVVITANSAEITGTGTAAAGGYTYVLTPQFASGELSYTSGGTCTVGGLC